MKVRNNSGVVKWLLIGLCAVFLVIMLILPLLYVVITALREGIDVYMKAVTDEYAVKSVLLTLEATVIAVIVNTVFGIFAAWTITKFRFRGKKVISTLIDLPLTISPIIAGLIYVLTFGRQSFLYDYLQNAGITIIFAVPGIVLATIFVTFPFISRELIPVLEAEGSCIDGSRRIPDFYTSYISPYQMGIPVRYRALYRKSDGRIWSSICFIRAFKRKNEYDAVIY